ncbi:hypothetical protein LS684_13540 [Cytobacillus spongiae]|uniref:hypothetical protein n=1 Tax=Cytobacillus spongiae TaxID=2901381 RepID=UPI001F444F11|nr:hypothetical protein [Cytobacillus spongiae]UII54682.1 hypothetical protein LS684_13540 [Cytobacillus spongiae]
MLKKQELDENQLEEILRQMPKIIDNRDPRDVYQNISLKMEKRKRKRWVMPSVATVAAVIILAILSPNLLNLQNGSSDLAFDTAESKNATFEMANDADRSAENKVEIYKKDEVESIEDDSTALTGLEEPKEIVQAVDTSAVYEADIRENEQVFTYAIPDVNAQIIVPVSIVVPRNEDNSLMDEYNNYMSQLQEEEWGLSEYYPFKGIISYDESSRIINVDLAKDHPYGEGSAAELIFKNVLSYELAAFDIEKVMLYTDGTPGVMLGNTGLISEIPVEDLGKRAFYFHYAKGVEEPYIVPSEERYNTIEEAFRTMYKDVSHLGLKAALAADIQMEQIEKSANNLTIHFSENTDLASLEQATNVIEAILLTAKDYGFENVLFKNTNSKQIGSFVMSEPIPVPLSANYKSIE